MTNKHKSVSNFFLFFFYKRRGNKVCLCHVIGLSCLLGREHRGLLSTQNEHHLLFCSLKSTGLCSFLQAPLKTSSKIFALGSSHMFHFPLFDVPLPALHPHLLTCFRSFDMAMDVLGNGHAALVVSSEQDRGKKSKLMRGLFEFQA